MSPIAVFVHQESAFVNVANIGGFAIDLENMFWNNMIEKELPKYKDRLNAIFPQPQFHTINVNTTFGHVFNNFYNCPINTTYVVDSKSILALALLNIVDSS
jgi:hypothetical protein